MTSVRPKIRDNRPPLLRSVATLAILRKNERMRDPEVAEVFAAIEGEDSYRATMLNRALEHLQTFVTRGMSDRNSLLTEYERWAGWYARTKMGAVNLRLWFEADQARERWIDLADPDDQLIRNAYAREALSVFEACLDLAMLFAAEQAEAA